MIGDYTPPGSPHTSDRRRLTIQSAQKLQHTVEDRYFSNDPNDYYNLEWRSHNAVNVSTKRFNLSDLWRAMRPADRTVHGDSMSPPTITWCEKPDNEHLAQLLTEDVAMLSLCVKLMEKLDREQFVEIANKALENFYLALAADSFTQLERLESHSSRKIICEHIADIITSKSFQYEEGKKRRIEDRDRSEEKSLEVLRHNSHHHHDSESEADHLRDLVHNPQRSEPTGSLKTREFESKSTRNVFGMKGSLQELIPFQVLLNDLRLHLLPPSIKDIVQTAEEGSLSLSNHDSNSRINRMKAFVEDFTMLKWNWWPLEPRMRRVSPNEIRLFWSCTCGTRLWRDISLNDANIISPMISHPISTSNLRRRCKRSLFYIHKGRIIMRFHHYQLSLYVGRGKTGTGFQTEVSFRRHTESAAPRSAAGARYTPSDITSASNSGVQGSQATSTGPDPNNTPIFTQATNQLAGSSVHTNIGQQAALDDPHILFGVKGPYPALKLEQISIQKTTNDSNFYEELKKYYRLNRGRLRYWFSFWRLGYCEVVKFQTYRPDYVFKEQKELPTSNDYEYVPRHPDAHNPPISRHEFSMHLNACGDSCRWASLTKSVPTFGGLLHECLPRLHTKRAINRIPKRKYPFDTSCTDDKNAYAWGLEARHEISAAYVACYHLLILALPFSFWGWWQATHPGDLQNASVPVTVALTMLSLFWGTNGILTQGRKLGEMGN